MRRLVPGVAGIRRLPLRVRLVAGFVLAMTVLLTAAGAFVYWRVRIDLDTGLDRDLSEQFAVTHARVTPDGRVDDQSNGAAGPASHDFQTLSVDGEVIFSGSGVGARSLLSASQLEHALRTSIHVQVGALLPASSRPLRLLAAPIAGKSPAAVLVVWVERDQRDEALRELLATLALAGFGALLIAAVVGERLAKAALAPVERYRAQAETIARGATGVRLDVPSDRDDEVTRLGHTFNDVLGALEHALERERSFVNDASHELRTPLTLLSARVQLLRRRPRTVHEHERALAELDTDIRDLIGLSDQLLELGSATNAQAIDPHTPTDLNEVVGAMDLAEIGVQFSTSTDRSVVSMPASQIRQVVNNLIVNARAHGEPPIDVTITSAEASVVLMVSDAGRGMPREFLSTATERFTRSDDARSRPGTGLGLALVDALVRGHGGEIRVCSNGLHHRSGAALDFACQHPARGTTITVALPTISERPDPDQRRDPASR